MKNKSSLWFFTNSKLLQIHTYGKGDRPTRTHNYQSGKDFQRAIKSFLGDGYDFIKDQGLN